MMLICLANVIALPFSFLPCIIAFVCLGTLHLGIMWTQYEEKRLASLEKGKTNIW